ncbi:MAG TPA: DUF4919 domain-containing protein [Candidatus Angelobacter sp.]|nr:DUF4919 domain-containing protein [Candidatus Angelobacter sp.]
MKTRSILWSLAIVLLCTAFAHGKENPAATASYEKALQQLKSGDLKIDFKALRINCAASKYECEADSADITRLFSLLQDKKYDQALKKVNQLLDKVFVDAELHYIAVIANSESGNKEKAEFHKAVIRGILDSIQENKRGQSEEDAFVVINVHEEYTFLQFSHMQVTKQSLSHKDGHTYDIMTCQDMNDKGHEVTAYFNVDIPTQILTDALSN